MREILRMGLVTTRLPNSRHNPRAAATSIKMILLPQLHPVMVVLWGESILRLNHPPET